jgi:hypothetical protein
VWLSIISIFLEISKNQRPSTTQTYFLHYEKIEISEIQQEISQCQ